MASRTTPSEPFSSSSSSSSRSNYLYDVFLSFRGQDTRNSFTDHLYVSLQRIGILTFRDDEELERGRSISSGLSQAIERSKIFVIVFSRNYASSSWCLDELVKIVECYKSGLVLLPIFFHVDPSDVRNQKGSIAEAFVNHEERYHRDKVVQWRRALTEAANLSGWHVHPDRQDLEPNPFTAIYNKLWYEDWTTFAAIYSLKSYICNSL